MLPKEHFVVVMVMGAICHVAHEVIQVILFIADLSWLFHETNPLYWRYTPSLALTRHLLYFGFDYLFGLLGLYHLYLLAGLFGLFMGGLVVVMFLIGDRVEW